mmetsp:Transcript_46593/g.75012  ORF Transcript_46593/g.75012 Transcript_46593/m.75012 type:complete len:218 (-) Transcript_46593:1002-1655(-)
MRAMPRYHILNTARQQVLLHLTRHLLAVAVVQKMIVNHSFPAIAIRNTVVHQSIAISFTVKSRSQSAVGQSAIMCTSSTVKSRTLCALIIVCTVGVMVRIFFKGLHLASTPDIEGVGPLVHILHRLLSAGNDCLIPLVYGAVYKQIAAKDVGQFAILQKLQHEIVVLFQGSGLIVFSLHYDVAALSRIHIGHVEFLEFVERERKLVVLQGLFERLIF